MSSIRFALEKLDQAVSKLDSSVTNVEEAFQNYVPPQEALVDASGNVIDVDFVARRLDNAIEQVETLLSEGE